MSATSPAPFEAPASELDEIAQRVDRALSALETLDATAKERALEVRRAIEAFHKEGLTRIVRSLKADPRGKELLLELAEDPTVYALFAMHGLVRAELSTRVVRVLDMVRPYLASHGGDVELVRIEGATAVVRLSGACHGCSMSATTLRTSVEEALKTHVPEIEAVEAETGRPEPAMVPIEALRGKGDLKGWVEGPEASEVHEGKPFRLELAGGDSAVLVRLGDRLQAFKNACAHLGMPLDGGTIDVEAGTLTCPWHGFRYDCMSGECLTAPEAQLEPFPLRIEKGRVYVRPQ